jgi:diaminopimelate decarboxylase
MRARIGLRINPSLDLHGVTHANIATGHDEAKFGVPRADVERAIALVDAAPHLDLVGIGAHIGSQFLSDGPYLESARTLFEIVRAARAAGAARTLAFVDAGGGFGIDYTGDRADAPRPADFVHALRREQHRAGLDDLEIVVEPGRSMVAAHGVLVARVIQAKVATSLRWLMIDAGMNDLMRPALYQARHRIVPLVSPAPPPSGAPSPALTRWRVVGPVCESSDDFGEHELPADPPSAVAILDAGAYGYTMASRYNGRQVPVEAFVSGGRLVAATKRDPVDAWIAERAAAGS